MTVDEFIQQLHDGMVVETEHNDVTGGDLVSIAKIALAHLSESISYYKKLKEMEDAMSREKAAVPDNSLTNLDPLAKAATASPGAPAKAPAGGKGVKASGGGGSPKGGPGAPPRDVDGNPLVWHEETSRWRRKEEMMPTSLDTPAESHQQNVATKYGIKSVLPQEANATVNRDGANIPIAIESKKYLYVEAMKFLTAEEKKLAYDFAIKQGKYLGNFRDFVNSKKESAVNTKTGGIVDVGERITITKPLLGRPIPEEEDEMKKAEKMIGDGKAANPEEDPNYIQKPMGPYCFSSDTNILTSKGIKPLSEVSIEDSIMTLNLGTDEIEYQKPIKVHSYEYNGDMIVFGGKIYNQKVTPNHKMVIRKQHEAEFQKVEARNVIQYDCNNIELKTSGIWRGVEDSTFDIGLPLWLGESNQDRWRYNLQHEFSMLEWVRFFGWWVSEGHVAKNHNTNNIIVSQSVVHPEYRNEIKKSIESLGFKPWEDKQGFGFTSKLLGDYLRKFGKSHDKYIPMEIRSLPVKYLQVLFDAMMKGDGSKDGRCYNTVSDKLRDDVVEIAIKLGYGATYSWDGHIWRIGVSRVSTTPRIRTNPYTQHYSGKVYCVTVPNGVIMVEREGKLSWSGNSDFDDCVAHNKDKGDPKAYCATIMRAIEGEQKMEKCEKLYRFREHMKSGAQGSISKDVKCDSVWDGTEKEKTLHMEKDSETDKSVERHARKYVQTKMKDATRDYLQARTNLKTKLSPAESDVMHKDEKLNGFKNYIKNSQSDISDSSLDRIGSYLEREKAGKTAKPATPTPDVKVEKDGDPTAEAAHSLKDRAVKLKSKMEGLSAKITSEPGVQKGEEIGSPRREGKPVAPPKESEEHIFDTSHEIGSPRHPVDLAPASLKNPSKKDAPWIIHSDKMTEFKEYMSKGEATEAFVRAVHAGKQAKIAVGENPDRAKSYAPKSLSKAAKCNAVWDGTDKEKPIGKG